MGCDGGTKALQRKYMRWKTHQDKNDITPEEVEAARWTYCALSGEELEDPICACELGYLYNKTAILEALLNKTLPEEYKHIRKMKDLIDVHFTYDDLNSKKKVEDTFHYWQASINAKRIICPISKEEVGLHSKFCILRTCGCVLSQKVLKEIPSDKCLNCGIPYTEDDVIILNGTPEERNMLRERMNRRRTKKSLKRNHHSNPIENSTKRIKKESKKDSIEKRTLKDSKKRIEYNEKT